MASFFANYTCEYNERKESIFCCTYVDEYICQADVVEGTWRFCPYCGEHLNIVPSALNIALPPSPPPEKEEYQEQNQEQSYVPPPRIKEAEHMWPFMVCKSIVRGLSWSYGTKINYRSHYALLTLLADRYNKTVDELVKINPVIFIGCPYKAKRLLGTHTYNKLFNRIQYQERYDTYVTKQKLNVATPSQ
jgi:hypothetical protein